LFRRPPLLATALLATALLLTTCAGEDNREDTQGEAAQRTENAQPPVRTAEGAPDDAPESISPGYGFTYGPAAGDRVERATEGLSDADPVQIELNGGPAWVVGVPIEDDTVWVVAYGSGEVVSFRLDGVTDEVTPYLTAPDALPAGAPPAVSATGKRLELLEMRNGSPLTHPVPYGEGYLGVSRAGTVVGASEPGVRALPDARPVVNESGAAALLTNPTTRYDHGVLGDDYEAASITVFGDDAATTIRPESGGVFEALAPMWFRPAPDQPELLAVTESVAAAGTRVSVYSADGNLVAAGPFAGEPQKWRHLMAAAPFGPDGETELAVTRTPHLGPRIELYRLEGDELRLVAEDPGYPTHTIYSRNLDAARAADTDGDGKYELIVTDNTYTGLVVLARTQNGMERSRSLPLGSILSTNVASTTDEKGRLYVAVGTMDGVLTIFR
jgi:hypothetical protein